MASLSPLTDHRRPRQLHAPPLLRYGASKAQARLAKIIAVISAVRPPPPPLPPPQLVLSGSGDPEGARPPAEVLGFGGVDLSLRLGLLPSPEIVGRRKAAEFKRREGNNPTESADVSTVEKSSLIFPPPGAEPSISPAASVAGGVALTVAKSSEGECDPEEEDDEDGGQRDKERVVVVEKDVKEASVVEEEDGLGGATTQEAGTMSSSCSSKGGRESGRQGYLDLLLEAVRQVSGPVFDEEPGEEKFQRPASPPAWRATRRSSAAGERASKRRETVEWIPYDLYDETAPIVRSKRGRSQALPSRYRDSVLEPWRKPPTVCRNHGRSTAKP